MSNYFSTLSNDALKTEIELMKRKVSQSRNQQEKIMLFALEAELDKRNQAMASSENEKFQKYYEKLESLKEELSEIDINRVSGEKILTTGVLANDLLLQIANVINEAVERARKLD